MSGCPLGRLTGNYRPVGGTLTYTASGTDSQGCSYSGTGTFPITPGKAIGNLGLVPERGRTQYFMGASWRSDEVTSAPSYPVKITCPDPDANGTTIAFAHLRWLGADPAGEQGPPDARTLAGSHDETAPNGERIEWTWALGAR